MPRAHTRHSDSVTQAQKQQACLRHSSRVADQLQLRSGGQQRLFPARRRLGEGSRRTGCRLTKAARWGGGSHPTRCRTVTRVARWGGGSHPTRCRTVTNRQITRRYWKRLKPGNQHHCKTRYHCSVVAQYTKRRPSF